MRIATTLAVLTLALVTSARAESIQLMSANSGLFVRTDARTGYLQASADSRQSASTLRLIPLGGDRVALQDPVTGKFVRAGIESYSYLAAVSDHIRGWETFRLVAVSGHRYALQSVQSGKYVRAGVGRGSFLAACSDQVGAWQEFLITVR